MANVNYVAYGMNTALLIGGVNQLLSKIKGGSL